MAFYEEDPRTGGSILISGGGITVTDPDGSKQQYGSIEDFGSRKTINTGSSGSTSTTKKSSSSSISTKSNTIIDLMKSGMPMDQALKVATNKVTSPPVAPIEKSIADQDTQIDKGFESGSVLPPLANAPSLYDSGLIDPNKPSNIPQSTWNAIQKGLANIEEQNKPVDTRKWYEQIESERGIDPSPYLTGYGYVPNDPDYDTILSDIENKQSIIKSNFDTVRDTLSRSGSIYSQLKSDLELVESHPGEQWKLSGEGFDPDKLYTSEELSGILKQQMIDTNKTRIDAIKNIVNIPKWNQQSRELTELKKDVETYEKLGYNIDINEDDSIQVSLPKATDVHKWYVGDGKVLGTEGSDILLGSSAFIESPLAVRSATDLLAETAKSKLIDWSKNVGSDPFGSTLNLISSELNLVGSTVWDAITGNRDVVPEHTKQRLADYSLDLSKTLKEGGGLGFSSKVLLSPAMIEGVYMPLATLGTGYVVTGLAGKTATTGASTLGGSLAKFGQTTGGKIVRGGIVGSGLALAGTGLTQLGFGLYDTARLQPESLPGVLGETAFSFGLAYGGWKTGEQLWKSKHTGSWHYNWQKGKAEWSPYEIPKPKDVTFIQPDVLVGEFDQGKAFFTGESQTMIGDQPADVWFKGIATQDPKNPKFAMSTGEGWVTTTKPKTLWGFNIGETSSSHRFSFKTPSYLMSQKGKVYLHFSLGESELAMGRAFIGSSGEILTNYAYGKVDPTYSRGLTLTGETGEFELPMFATEWKGNTLHVGGELISSKKYSFLHSGKYTSGDIFGKVRGVGRMFAYDIKGGGHGIGGGATGEGISLAGEGGGLLQKFDMGSVMDVVSGKVGSALDLGLPGGQQAGSSTVSLSSNVAKADIISTPYQSMGSPQQLELLESNMTQMQPLQNWNVGLTLVTGTETVQKTNRTNRHRRRSISLLNQDLDIDQDVGELGRYGYKHMQEPVSDLFEEEENLLGLGTGLDMGITQLQLQEQQQDLSLVSGLNLFTINLPYTFNILNPNPIPPVPIPLLENPNDDRRRRRKTGSRIKQRPLSLVHDMDKGLLSDLASVTRSQGRYGVATHPKLTEDIWRMGERSMFMHVPTVELMIGKKKKKKSKKKLDITNRRMSDVLI